MENWKASYSIICVDFTHGKVDPCLFICWTMLSSHSPTTARPLQYLTKTPFNIGWEPSVTSLKDSAGIFFKMYCICWQWQTTWLSRLEYNGIPITLLESCMIFFIQPDSWEILTVLGSLSKLNSIYCIIYIILCIHTTCFTDLMLYGVGYHHAGIDVSDRKIIEATFTEGDLPVLCKIPLN